MADVFSPQKRSEIMALVRSVGNASTEERLARLFRAHRITSWRRSVKMLGSPDFVWRRDRIALFVDGCFWHGCSKHATWPKGNAVFWRNKISRNKVRDRMVTKTLKKEGWQVLRIWEHELAKKNEGRLLRRISLFLSLG